jgi:hypothetical protein
MLPGEISLMAAAQRVAELQQGLMQLEERRECDEWILVFGIKIPNELQ